ncbi:expansin EXLX1 family cellulose-binding protein [Nocardia sp. NBC_01499]|uniref:expansin EXLX1 family cellulose-binding protein n=1 Tax=Nocardia sp. NBC_01499 TaxID=2903597 RepID=UPI0038703388
MTDRAFGQDTGSSHLNPDRAGRRLARHVVSRMLIGVLGTTVLCLSSVEAGPAAAAPDPDSASLLGGTGIARSADLNVQKGACSLPKAGTYAAAVSRGVFSGSLACGAALAVTGKGGTVRVEVVDVCDPCAGGDIRLNPAAFAMLGSTDQDEVPVSWKLTDAEPVGGLTYLSAAGSNEWWWSLQVSNSRYPVAKVEFIDENQWKLASRDANNYFICNGARPPYTFRLTELGGNVVQENLKLVPGKSYQGTQQFPTH